MPVRLLAVLLFAVSFHLQSAQAADWPQYRGPDRNDVSAETGLLQEWPAGGPPLLWTYARRRRRLLGAGDRRRPALHDRRPRRERVSSSPWTSPAADSRQRSRGPRRSGRCFTGKATSWSAGPSATPTVDGDLIFALGGNGDLVCVEAASGKEVWRKNLPADLEAEVNPDRRRAEEARLGLHLVAAGGWRAAGLPARRAQGHGRRARQAAPATCCGEAPK